MREANREKPGTYSPEEVEAALKKLEAGRSTLNRAARKAKGLVDSTREQRQKVKDMKVANAEKSDTYTAEEVNAECIRLRELMCKHSKRTFIPNGELRVQAAASQRDKIKDMRTANLRAPGGNSQTSNFCELSRAAHCVEYHII